MSRLSTEKRAQIIGCLVERMSIRATVRATGAARTVRTWTTRCFRSSNGVPAEAEMRHSPAECIGVETRVTQGDPDPDLISPSCMERQHLTMRMGIRRMTRLTNAFSKNVEYLAAAVPLHFMHYNFARPHKGVSDPYSRSPAMAAGVADHVSSLEKIAALLG